ncbi:MAG TPA: aldo/keto reductase [Solirubrobacteraceae bacterium]|jgi:2,5-diketo-D-gluconate reductase A
MSTSSPTRKLSDGTEIPTLGFGVWQVADGHECESAVLHALELGYRHIDTAQAYGNEASVGRALRASGVPRDEVFVTTKFFPRNADPVEAVEESLRLMQLDHVDLYIIHWPEGGPTWAWQGMEQARERGYARSIGVSNFSVSELSELAEVASISPTVNQVQFSPFEYRRALLERCERDGIAIEAYSPLGTGRHLSSPEIAEIAEQVDRTAAQVLIRWCLQKNTIVLPKSTHRERIEQNAEVFDFELSDEQTAVLDALDQTGSTELAREQKWW